MEYVTRQRTKSEWEKRNSILRDGEYGLERDTGKVKLGNGIKRWSQLPYVSDPPPLYPPDFESPGGGSIPVDVVRTEELTEATAAAQRGINEAFQKATEKYTRPASGIPEEDLATPVRNKLNTAASGGVGDNTIGPLKLTKPVRDVVAPRSLSSFSGSRGSTVTKYAGNPIATRAQVGLSTIYTPCLVRVPDSVYAANPTMGRHRIYTSTDHDSGDGGVAMMHCDAVNLDDPGATWKFWRSSTGGVKMFYDGAGKQTETPNVIWNPLTNLFHMYYQREFGTGATLTQTTCLATSPDGLTWTVMGPVFPNPATTLAGYDHTGYVTVSYVNGLWIGAGNVGSGTTVTSQAIWYSYNGYTWIRDPKMNRGMLQFTDGTLRTSFSSFFRYRGEIWASGRNAEFKSGAATSSIAQNWLAPMRDDLRGLKGRPQYVPFAPTGIETSPPPGLPSVWAEGEDGRLWGAYRINGATGAYGLAVMS